MEHDSGAKIAIRGKGSVKEGKGRNEKNDNLDEDLHCLVTADSEQKVPRPRPLLPPTL
jgi:splicing factor 1